MSANKYANLPDIDTAPDVYETEDVFPSSHDNNGHSTDDEPSTARNTRATKATASATTDVTNNTTSREELDVSHLISPDQASQRFRKAELARYRQRTRYAYPPSSSDETSRSRSGGRGRRKKEKTLTLPMRLRVLQAELAALEAELEDPSNPALRVCDGGEVGGEGGEDQNENEDEDGDGDGDGDENEDEDGDENEDGDEGGDENKNENENSKVVRGGGGVDPGEMIMGLVDVRQRLEKVRKGREGRGRLVGVIIGEGDRDRRDRNREEHEGDDEDEDEDEDGAVKDGGSGDIPAEMKGIVEMDRRVGELEKLVGSVGATLDETTPLTPPLLPMLMRLHNQLTLLTQPRHIDSVSRRLKLLLSDLERVSASQAQKRQQAGAGVLTVLTPAQDAVLPLLSRLAPSLPHIPHILTRLRTLSALHASASEFQSTMASLEEEQRRTREALEALSGAIKNVESSLEANRHTVAGNVTSLEDRVDKVLGRLEQVAKQGTPHEQM